MEEQSSSFRLSTPLSILIAGIIIALSIVYVGRADTKLPAVDLPIEEPQVAVRAPGGEDHVLGSSDAELVLIEYSDFECPFCARIHETLHAIVESSGGNVAWVYRHFPLVSIHANAFPAALASECAAKRKGGEAFFAFSEILFKNQGQLGTPLYQKAAESLGISAAELTACVDAREGEARIKVDYDEAVAAGGQGTPFVIIRRKDGEQAAFSGALPREYIEQLLDSVAKR